MNHPFIYSVCYMHTLVLLMFHSVLDNNNNGSFLHWPESGMGYTHHEDTFNITNKQLYCYVDGWHENRKKASVSGQ